MKAPLVLALVLFASPVAAQESAAQDGEPAAQAVPAAEPVAPAPTPPKTSVAATLRTAPVGHAAPATEAATHGSGAVRAGLEIFAAYGYQNLVAQDGARTWYHAFDLPRAHAALEGESENARGRVVLEAVRSAAEGALVGVAGDSLVLRVREAYGAYRPWAPLELSGGVLPTATIPTLDGTWMMRAVAPSALEASGLASPADLGVRARSDLPARYGWVSVSAYNGEGYANRELNRGKNVELATEVHPLAGAEATLPLGVFASYVGGSAGTSKVRADRVTGGLVWQGARVRGGAFGTYAWGVRDAARQNAIVLTAFVRVEPVERLLLGARADHFVRDTNLSPEDRLSTILGSGGWRFSDALEAFLAISRSLPTTRAQSSLPGSDAWDARVVGRIVF